MTGEMKFSLPGAETITLAGSTVDKLLRAGDGDAALLYLYILKTHSRCTSADAEKALGKGAGAVASAMALLSRLGLIQCDSEQAPQPAPREEPREYTADEIQRELENGSNFSFVVDEAQRSLGKILSPDELSRLFGIYDALRLPPDVIMLLITHCIDACKRRGTRMPSMRYIEKAAYTWEREGLFSIELAERYLKDLDALHGTRAEIKQALQIKDRELSATEQSYADEWAALGFGAEAIAIAYDRTVLKTGKLAWRYLDSIIKSWHSKGLHTADEILEKDKRTQPRPTSAVRESESKRPAPSLEDIQHMQRLLKKIREE